MIVYTHILRIILYFWNVMFGCYLYFMIIKNSKPYLI